MSSRKSKKRIGSTRRHLGHKTEERAAEEQPTEVIPESPEEADNAGNTGELSTATLVQLSDSSEMSKCKLDVVPENINADQHDPGKTNLGEIGTGEMDQLSETEKSAFVKIRRMGSTRRVKQGFQAEDKMEDEETVKSMLALKEESNVMPLENTGNTVTGIQEIYSPEVLVITQSSELGFCKVEKTMEKTEDESPSEEHSLLSEFGFKTEAETSSSDVNSSSQSFSQSPSPAVDRPVCVIGTPDPEEEKCLFKQDGESYGSLTEGTEAGSNSTARQDTPTGCHQQEDQRESDEQKKANKVTVETQDMPQSSASPTTVTSILVNEEHLQIFLPSSVDGAVVESYNNSGSQNSSQIEQTSSTTFFQEEDEKSEQNVQRPKKRMGSTRRPLKIKTFLQDNENSQIGAETTSESTMEDPKITKERLFVKEDTKFKEMTELNYTSELAFTVSVRGAEAEGESGEFEEQQNKQTDLVLCKNKEGDADTEAPILTDVLSDASRTTSSNQFVMEGDLDHHHQIVHEDSTNINQEGWVMVETSHPDRSEEQISIWNSVDDKTLQTRTPPHENITQEQSLTERESECGVTRADIESEFGEFETISGTNIPAVEESGNLQIENISAVFSTVNKDYVSLPPVADDRVEMMGNPLNVQDDSDVQDYTKTDISHTHANEKGKYLSSQSEGSIFNKKDLSEQAEHDDKVSCTMKDPGPDCEGTAVEDIAFIQNTKPFHPQLEEDDHLSFPSITHQNPQITDVTQNVQFESSTPEVYSFDLPHSSDAEQGTQSHILSFIIQPVIAKNNTDLSDGLHDGQTKEPVIVESTETSETTVLHEDSESTLTVQDHTEEGSVKQAAPQQKRRMGSTRRTKRPVDRTEEGEGVGADGGSAIEDMKTDTEVKKDSNERPQEVSIVGALEENESSIYQTDTGFLSMDFRVVKQEQCDDSSLSTEGMSSSLPPGNPLEDGEGNVTAQQIDGNDGTNPDVDHEISILGKREAEITTVDANLFNEAFTIENIDQLQKGKEENSEGICDSPPDQNKENSINKDASEQAEHGDEVSEDPSPDCGDATVENICIINTKPASPRSTDEILNESLYASEHDNLPASSISDHTPEITHGTLNVQTQSSTLYPPTDTSDSTTLHEDSESTFQTQHHTEEGSVKQAAPRQKRRMGSTRRTKRPVDRTEEGEGVGADGGSAIEGMKTDTEVKEDSNERPQEMSILGALKENESSIYQTGTGILSMDFSVVKKEQYDDSSQSTEGMPSSLPPGNPLEAGEGNITAQQLDGNDGTNPDGDHEISILGNREAEIAIVDANRFNVSFTIEDIGQLTKGEEENSEGICDSLPDQNKGNSISKDVSEQAEHGNEVSEDPSPDCGDATMKNICVMINTKPACPGSTDEILNESLYASEHDNLPASSISDHTPEITHGTLNVQTESSTLYPPTDTSDPTTLHEDSESTFQTQHHTEEGSVKQAAPRQKRRMGSTRRTKRPVDRTEEGEGVGADGGSAIEDMKTDTEVKKDSNERPQEVSIVGALKENESSIYQTGTGILSMDFSVVKKEQYDDSSQSTEGMSSSLPPGNPLEAGEGNITAQQLDGNDGTNPDGDHEISILGNREAEIAIVDANRFNVSFTIEDIGQLTKGEEENSEGICDSLPDQNKGNSISKDVSEQAEHGNEVSEDPSPDCGDATMKNICVMINTKPACPGSTDESLYASEHDHLSASSISDHTPDITHATLNVQTESSTLYPPTDTANPTTLHEDSESTLKLQDHTEEGSVKQAAPRQKRRMGSTRRTKRQVDRTEEGEGVGAEGDNAIEDINIYISPGTGITENSEDSEERTPESLSDLHNETSVNKDVLEQAELDKVSCLTDNPRPDCPGGNTADDIDDPEKSEYFLLRVGVGTVEESFGPSEQKCPPSCPTSDSLMDFVVAPLNVRAEMSIPEIHSPDIQHSDEAEQVTPGDILISTIEPLVSDNFTEASEFLKDGWTEQSQSHTFHIESHDVIETAPMSDHSESTGRLPHSEQERDLEQCVSRPKRKMGSTRRQKRQGNEVNLEFSHETGTEIFSQLQDLQSEQIPSCEEIESACSTTTVVAVNEYETQTQDVSEELVSEPIKEDVSNHDNSSLCSMEKTTEATTSLIIHAVPEPQLSSSPDDNQNDVSLDTAVTVLSGHSEAAQVETVAGQGKDSTDKEPEQHVRDVNKVPRRKIGSTRRVPRRREDEKVEGEAEEKEETHTSEEPEQNKLEMMQEEGEAQRVDNLGPSETQTAVQCDKSSEGQEMIEGQIKNPSPEIGVSASQYQETEESPSFTRRRKLGSSRSRQGKQQEKTERKYVVMDGMLMYTDTEISSCPANKSLDGEIKEGQKENIRYDEENKEAMPYISVNTVGSPPMPESLTINQDRGGSDPDGKDELSKTKQDVLASPITTTEWAPLEDAASNAKDSTYGDTDVDDQVSYGATPDNSLSSDNTLKLTQLESSDSTEESKPWKKSQGHNVTKQSEISDCIGIPAAEEANYSKLCQDESEEVPKSMLQKRKMGSSRRGQGLRNRAKGEVAKVDDHTDVINTARLETNDTTYGALPPDVGNSEQKDSSSLLPHNKEDLSVEGGQSLTGSVQSRERAAQPQEERPDESIDEKELTASAQCIPSVLTVSSPTSSDNPTQDPQSSPKKRKMGSTRRNTKRQGEQEKNNLQTVQGFTKRLDDDMLLGSVMSENNSQPDEVTDTVSVPTVTKTQEPEDSVPRVGNSTGLDSAGPKGSPQGTKRKMGSRRAGQGYRGIGVRAEPEDQAVSKDQVNDSSILPIAQEKVLSEIGAEQGASRVGSAGAGDRHHMGQRDPSAARRKSDLERMYGQGKFKNRF
ncbi:hypothetical protein ACEWY4_013227 [Coilia grayii]|uniref:Uncharacterized protein n=1 Tax=Coilia grayii TaxID=363190 RepID=A0ABD1JVT7_9TELE